MVFGKVSCSVKQNADKTLESVIPPSRFKANFNLTQVKGGFMGFSKRMHRVWLLRSVKLLKNVESGGQFSHVLYVPGIGVFTVLSLRSPMTTG